MELYLLTDKVVLVKRLQCMEMIFLMTVKELFLEACKYYIY